MRKETFDFSEALRRMKGGKVVRRRVWKSLYAYIKYNILIFRHFHSFGILDIPYSNLDGEIDRTTTDWEEVKE